MLFMRQLCSPKPDVFTDLQYYKRCLSFVNLECMSGYTSRGNICYKKFSRRPWTIAKCPKVGDEQTVFASPETEDENTFIYKTFSEPSGQTLWINARVCGEEKLCGQDFGKVYYHNFVGTFPTTGCVEMPNGKNGQWVAKNCDRPPFVSNYYVCKYGKCRHEYCIGCQNILYNMLRA